MAYIQEKELLHLLRLFLKMVRIVEIKRKKCYCKICSKSDWIIQASMATFEALHGRIFWKRALEKTFFNLKSLKRQTTWNINI